MTGYNGGNGLPAQFAYMAAWEDANAEGMGLADLTSFWTHGTDPTGLLTTMTHASLISNVIGDDPGGLGVLLGEHSAVANRNQIPIGYSSGFSHSNKLGVRCLIAQSTLLSFSDQFSAGTWAVSNAAVSIAVADLNDSPRGTLEAEKLVASAANGYVQDLFVSVAATLYSFDAFVKRHSTMGGNVAGALIMYDATGAAIVATQAFTATDEWQRVTLRATSLAGQISTGFRVRIDTNGEALSIFRATAVTGEIGAPIYSITAPSTMALTDFRASSAGAGDYMKGAQGELEVTYICDIDDETFLRVICDQLSSLGGDQDRREMRIETNEFTAGQIYDSAAAYLTGFGALAVQSNEHMVRLRWDVNNLLPGGTNLEVIIDGVTTTDPQAPWAVSDLVKDIFVGQENTITRQLNGTISRIRIWEHPR